MILAPVFLHHHHHHVDKNKIKSINTITILILQKKVLGELRVLEFFFKSTLFCCFYITFFLCLWAMIMQKNRGKYGVNVSQVQNFCEIHTKSSHKNGQRELVCRCILVTDRVPEIRVSGDESGSRNPGFGF